MKKASLALATVLLAACGNLGSLGDLGDLGDILGSSNPNTSSDVRGTVVRVDTTDRRIDLDVNMVNNLRDDRAGSSVYYDANTDVVYQNRNYRPEDLERGDQVAIRGANVNGRYVADRIEVLRDIS